MSVLLRVLALLIVGCAVSPVISKLKIRLVNGKEPYMGKIEVWHDDRWGEVCDHGWDYKGARVVCRMLGYPDAIRFTFGDWFGRGTGYFWLDDLKCNGTEDSLDECPRKPWGETNCQAKNMAGVVCKQHEKDLIIKPKTRGLSELPVRLVGPIENDQIREGILQIKVNGEWGYVCPKFWIHMNSRVACGMLGFKDYIKTPMRVLSARAKGKPPLGAKARARARPLSATEEVQQDDSPKAESYLMSEVSCGGHEASLVECKHVGFGPIKCDEGFPVIIKCMRSDPVRQPETVRLRSGVQLWEGRVEVTSDRYRNYWGSVCDDRFTHKEANVVCRALGWGTAKYVYRNAWFGQATGKIFMDDVSCRGWEKNLHSCKYRNSRRGNCDHYEDVGVRCNAPTLYNHKIRLTGGETDMDGRVEFFMDGQWGTVCGDSWGLKEAIVVCRHLELGFAKEFLTLESESEGNVSMVDTRCTGKERSLLQCRQRISQSRCPTNMRAGVRCVKKLPDLVVNIEELGNDRNYRIDQIPLAYLSCAFEENCLSASANRDWPQRHFNMFNRRLIRFSNRIENRGLDHFKPKSDKSQWTWHSCHKHYHSMEVFSTYDLIDDRGQKVAEGHKASFCLEDTGCDAGIHRHWNCTDGGDQGVKPNCYDEYKWTIDCQWIDVTDRPHGNYRLQIKVNPNQMVAETDYDNNIAMCDAYDYGSFLLMQNCYLDHCYSGVRTTSGNSYGACCYFPFKYRGKLYDSCTKFGYNQAWCSTTGNFDRERKWGVCVDL